MKNNIIGGKKMKQRKYKEELEALEQSLETMPELISFGRFSVVSRIYSQNFKKVTFMVLNSETGEITKKVLENDI